MKNMLTTIDKIKDDPVYGTIKTLHECLKSYGTQISFADIVKVTGICQSLYHLRIFKEHEKEIRQYGDKAAKKILLDIENKKSRHRPDFQIRNSKHYAECVLLNEDNFIIHCAYIYLAVASYADGRNFRSDQKYFTDLLDNIRNDLGDSKDHP